jgi:hypothetical protein
MTDEQDLGKKEGKDIDPTTGEACDDISDPIRRSLCKVCNMPVIGDAPFCQEHEPPVP